MAQDDLYRLTQLGAWAPEGSREAQLHSLYDWVFKLLGTSPLTDAGQAVGAAAVGENAKTPLKSRCFLKDHLHTDAAHFVLARLEGKRLVHLMFKCQHTHLLMSFPLFWVKGVEDLKPADLTHVPMQVDTGIFKLALPSGSIGAQLLLIAAGVAGLL